MADFACELFVMGPHSMPPRSYGRNPIRVQRLATSVLLTLLFALGPAVGVKALERPVKIVVLGDSLSAGFGLPMNDAFPAKLAKALDAKGIGVAVVNAGVS